MRALIRRNYQYNYPRNKQIPLVFATWDGGGAVAMSGSVGVLRGYREMRGQHEMNERIGELLAPTRLMLTPGPCSVDSRVYRALSTPMVGHMDPFFIGLIGEVQTLLREVFQTENKFTFPISASGSGGIETAVVNTLEPGDEAIVCVNGTFSERMAIIASRTGSTIHRAEAPLGHTVDPDDVRRAGKGRKIKFVGVCHGETSTGVITSLDPFRKVADELGALLIVDAVATLAGVPLDVDKQRIDICFSGSQKAISAPPGMAPITVGPRMEELLANRKTPVQSWYFDLTGVMKFWGKERTYHHTPAISLIFALREALRIVSEEGLAAGAFRARSERPPAYGHQRARPCGSRRGAAAPATAGRIRHRDCRGHWYTQRKNLASRADGLQQPSQARASVPGGARKGAARAGIPCACGSRNRCGGPGLCACRGGFCWWQEIGEWRKSRQSGCLGMTKSTEIASAIPSAQRLIAKFSNLEIPRGAHARIGNS